MAEKNYKKQIELMRFLINEGNSLKNKDIAEKLGMSQSTFQKTAQQLNLVIHDYRYDDMEEAQALNAIEQKIFYDVLQGVSEHIYKIFAIQDSNPIRRKREVAIVQLLHEHEMLTYTGIRHELTKAFPNDEDLLIEESQIKRIVKNLEEEGLVVGFKQKVGKLTKTYYQAETFFSQFTKEQLLGLYHFVTFCKYNAVLPAVAYFIEYKLLRYLALDEHPQHTFYPYTYPGRALDDPLVYELIEAIAQQQFIEMKYSNVSLQRKFTSDESSDAVQTKIVKPLQLVYDAMYSRWYLIAAGSSGRAQRYRIDYMKSIKVHSKTSITIPDIEKVQQQLAQSWNISGQPLEKVVVRFYQYDTTFIEQRVQQQGRDGRIVTRYEDGFLWAIEVRGTSEIKPWLRSFGSSAEVHEPISLREQFIAEWKELQQLYDDYSSLS